MLCTSSLERVISSGGNFRCADLLPDVMRFNAKNLASEGLGFLSNHEEDTCVLHVIS